MPHYRLKVKHDHGTQRLVTFASNKKQARVIVMAAEGCPDRAIKKVTNLKRRVVLIDTGAEVEVRRTAPVKGKDSWITDFTNGKDAMDFCARKKYSYIVIDLSEK
jgi:hypothetical protein